MSKLSLISRWLLRPGCEAAALAAVEQLAANGQPFTFVEFLTRRAGFTRSEPQAVATNGHPAVMFEIIANDQAHLKTFYQTVFHWNYPIGTGDFAYVKFPVQTLPLLVDDLQATITAALAAGASKLADPADIDGYHFAMIKDPEGNPIGLIQPFTAN